MKLIDIFAVALVASVLTVGAVLLCQCGPLPTPDPPPQPDPQGGAGPVLSDCEAAEERLRELECRDDSGTPLWQTPGGEPFADACEYSASRGRDWCPAAIARITSCPEIDAAMRSCK